MKQVTQTLSYKVEERIFWGLATLLLLGAGFYLYFISSSIINVLVREEAEIDIAHISSELGSLEAQYLVKKQGVDAAFAAAQGFVITSPSHFVSRGTSGLTVNQ